MNPRTCKKCGKEFYPEKVNYWICPECYWGKVCEKCGGPKEYTNSRMCHSCYFKSQPGYGICESCGAHFEPKEVYYKICPECDARINHEGVMPVQCKAICKNGEQCRNNAKWGGAYCGIHKHHHPIAVNNGENWLKVLTEERR